MKNSLSVCKSLIILICAGGLLMACNTAGGVPETERPDAVRRSLPFSRGVNFSQWFEVYSAQAIQFTRYIEQDFADVKSMGADHIRLPVRMHSLTLGAPDYTLDPLLLEFMDTAVDWAEKYKLYIIIDNHSYDPVAPTAETVDEILLKIWTQIAERYKDRGEFVVYEILNEPHGIPDARWGEIQGEVIDAIREIDATRLLIVGGTDYNSIGKLYSLPDYADSKLIYTFHFYDPHIFTHQGATWGSPSLASLAGIPFPANRKRIPPTPADLKGTWIDAALKNYEHAAALSTLGASLDRAVAFALRHDAPVYCGEFGVYMIQSPTEDRVKWYECITAELDKRNIARASWDYFGGFGIFNSPAGGDFHSDLNTGVVRALGLTPPPQRTKIARPLNAPFIIYDDHPSRDFAMGYWGEDVDFSMYDTRAAEGKYAIRWGNLSQYDTFWIEFNRNGDFSELVSQGYSLEFRARSEQAVRFDVRFVNPETSTSIPWRMRYAIDSLPPDGNWHTIRVPLAAMSEHGAWLNATAVWLNPQGRFSWKNVRQLDFVSEEGDQKECYLWVDSIKITK